MQTVNRIGIKQHILPAVETSDRLYLPQKQWYNSGLGDSSRGRRDPVWSVYVMKANCTGGHAYKQQSKRAISCPLSINLPLFWIFPLRRGSPKRIRIVKCPSVALFLCAYKAYKTNRLGIYQHLKLGWNLRKWYHILTVSLLKYFIVVNLIDLVLAVRESQQVFDMHNPPTL